MRKVDSDNGIAMAKTIDNVSLLNVAYAPMLSMSMTEIAMANSISNVMGNAVTAQQNCQVIENATVVQCCALMIAAGIAKAAS